MEIFRTTTFFFFLLMVLTTKGVDFSRINVSWQYDPLAEIEFRHRIIQDGSIMTLFLRFRTDSVSNWDMELLVQPKYESEVHSSLVNYKLDTLVNEQNRLILKIVFEKPEENLMVVKTTQEGVFYYYDIPLKNGTLPFPSIYPQDGSGIPIFTNYLNKSTFKWEGSNQFYCNAYVENFSFADPPMAEMKPLAPSILPDSTFSFTNPIDFDENRFYVVMADSNAVTGVTILNTSPYFPEYKLLSELTSCMFYILNEPERKGFLNSNNLKESFDSFWIKTYITKFRARNAIRNYFNWVEQANRIFSDFKSGWKTDRGMLFIVYGVPDEVYRRDNVEEWYYDEGPAFEFTVISTFFSPRTYALRRRQDYEESWYEYIAAIRRGAND